MTASYLALICPALLAWLGLYAGACARASVRAFDEANGLDRPHRVAVGARRMRPLRVASALVTVICLSVVVVLAANDARLSLGIALLLTCLPAASLITAVAFIRYRAHVVGAPFSFALVFNVLRGRAGMALINLLVVAAVVALCTLTARVLQPRWMVLPFCILMTALVVLLASLAQPALISFLNAARPIAGGAFGQLVERAGLDGLSVRVFHSGLRAANAWIAGPSVRRPRVFVTDTLVDSISPDELLAIVAHEVAHAKERHIRHLLYRRMIALLASMATFVLLVQLASWAKLSLPPVLVYVISTAVSALVVYFTTGRSRRSPGKELEADALAASWVGAEPLGRALQRLFELNQASDDAVAARRLSTHPALRERLANLHLATKTGG